MPKLRIFLFTFIVFILIAGIYFILITSLIKQSDANFLGGTKNADTEADNQNNEKENQANAGVSGRVIEGGNAVGVGGGGGGGSSSSSSGAAGSGAQSAAAGGNTAGENSNQNCIEQQISYALKNFIKRETCNEFQQNTCVDKTVDCYLEVHNFDSSVSGIFSIKFTFLDNGIAFDNAVIEKNVNPEDFEIFNAVLELQSQGEEGRANQQIDCSFNTQEVPKKVVCN